LGGLKKYPENYKIAYNNANKANIFSRSNGSLMRCTPIAVWASSL
jgi:ADP-ribosylglycohydrolase